MVQTQNTFVSTDVPEEGTRCTVGRIVLVTDLLEYDSSNTSRVFILPVLSQMRAFCE